MSLIAFDYGERRIGVAITDESNKMTSSLPYISNNSELKKINKKDFPKGTDPKEIAKARREAKKDSKIELRKVFNKILYLVNSYYPEKLLLGLPLSFDSKENIYKEGMQAKKVRSFAKKLDIFLKKNNIICEIVFLEESMSSQIAASNLSDFGLTSDKIREKIDSESARILLEGYIESKDL